MSVDLSRLQTHLLIDGQFVKSASGKTYSVINPATGDKIADVQSSEKEDIDKAVAAARKAFLTWGKSSARYRARLLYKLADLIEQHKEELGRLETLNTGKPFRTHVMKADIPQAIECYRYYAGWADKNDGRVLPGGQDTLTFTEYEPVGVAAQIIPWNWPLMMQAWKFGPALASGCTVVLKPSHYTPLSALKVGELALEAGFPPGVINIIPGFGSLSGDSFTTHPGIDKIAFTGSTSVGKQIQKASGESDLKRVSLELGGKGALLVFADSDLDQAARVAYEGIFFNAGQNCSAASRTYVEESIYNAFIQKVLDLVKRVCPIDLQIYDASRPRSGILSGKILFKVLLPTRSSSRRCFNTSKRDKMKEQNY
jgi:aldehyde dehydrogenase (NAD+)